MVDELPFGNEDFSRLSKFIRQHINYSMEKQGVVGRIVFSFVVDSDGSISDRRISNKKESEYSVFEREFLKAFEMMNYWRPGKCAGKAVPLRVTIPMSMNWQ